jgi:GT2 family glycosyltransferase
VLVANSPADHISQVTSRECTLVPVDAGGNLGFSPAVNLALASAPDADFVLLLNPDARLGKESLKVLLSTAVSWRAAVVGPLLCNELDEPNGISERPFHSVHREAATQFLGAERRRPPYGRRAYETGHARCLTGACLLVEATFLRAVGGLDTEISMYLEDVMLCWQAHQRGLGVAFAPSARCYHALGASAEGENFASSLGLHLTLLGARIAFVRRTSGAFRASLVRALIGIGAALRAVCTSGPRRRKHLSILRWTITSGKAPPWREGPVVGGH